MSSYFDTMGRCLYDKGCLADLVLTQYRAYLIDLADTVLKADEDKLAEIAVRIYEKRFEQERDPAMKISMIHDLAHDIGRAGIRLRGGMMAGDNPRLAY